MTDIDQLMKEAWDEFHAMDYYKNKWQPKNPGVAMNLDSYFEAGGTVPFGFENNHFGMAMLKVAQTHRSFVDAAPPPPPPPPPPPTTTQTGLSLLRINPNEALPADLTKYDTLILDAYRYDQVAGLKQKYPRLRVYCYRNLSFVADYAHGAIDNCGVTWEQAQNDLSWWLLDKFGSRVNSRGYSHLWFMDVGLPAYQQAWLKNVNTWLMVAPWDGVFLDDTNADQGYHVGGNYALLAKYPSRDEYRMATRSMLAAVCPPLKQVGYTVIPNVGASWDQPDVWADWSKLCSGAMREHYLKWGEAAEPVFIGNDWRVHTDAQRATVGEFYAATYGPADAAKQRYVRCSFLLFWNGQGGSSWSPDDTASQTALGQPTGAAVQSGSVWTRQFEHGTVRVDTAAGTASVT